MNLKYITFFLLGICTSTALNDTYAMKGADKDQEKKPARERTENMRTLAQTEQQSLPQRNLNVNGVNNQLSFVNQDGHSFHPFQPHCVQQPSQEWVPYAMLLKSTQNSCVKCVPLLVESAPINHFTMNTQQHQPVNLNLRPILQVQPSNLNTINNVTNPHINSANQNRQLGLIETKQAPQQHQQGLRQLRQLERLSYEGTLNQQPGKQKSEQKEVVDLTGSSQKRDEAHSAFQNGNDSKTEDEKEQK